MTPPPPAVVRAGAVHLSTVGYGTGVLLGRGVKRVRDVLWLEELGIAPAMWVFEVERLGPFLVDSDAAGNSLLERKSQALNARFGDFYAGLKPPALSGFCETTKRDGELI